MSYPKEIQEFFNAVLEEEKRVHEVLKLHTGQGMSKAVQIWQDHFKQPYVHGINTKYDIARVNVIRRSNGGDLLC